MTAHPFIPKDSVMTDNLQEAFAKVVLEADRSWTGNVTNYPKHLVDSLVGSGLFCLASAGADKSSAEGAKDSLPSGENEPVVTQALPSAEANCVTCSGDGHIDVGAYRDVKCPDCDGSGSRTISVPGCCGNGTKTGECCGNAIEMPGEEACQSCSGSGRIPPTTDQRREEIAETIMRFAGEEMMTRELADLCAAALDGGDR